MRPGHCWADRIGCFLLAGRNVHKVIFLLVSAVLLLFSVLYGVEIPNYLNGNVLPLSVIHQSFFFFQMSMLIALTIMLLFFYNAPTGLNLYIMASTFGGLIEQHFIRKHLKKEEAKAAETAVTTTTKVTGKFGPKKKKPKPPRRFY